MINEGKYMMSIQNLEEEEIESYMTLFPFEVRDFDDGIKYLGFHLKPNNYKNIDWMWMLAKLEKRLNTWSYKYLS
jgi:hypothetical protein